MVLGVMALTQLNPTLPVEVEGKGKGMCFAIIDTSDNHNLLFVTILDASGEIWCAPSPKVRAQSNWSFGRAAPSFDHG